MSELRWVLLLLGAVVIGLVWAVGSGRLSSLLARVRRGVSADSIRREPIIDAHGSGDAEGEAEPVEETVTQEPEVARAAASNGDSARIDRVITVRFVPRGKPLPADKTVLALRAAGFRHGQYGIFHKFADETSRESLYSVANLTEPGSFDLTNLSEATIPGMNFFLVLPGPGDPVDRFDSMVDAARELARELDADLRDERGSSWSIQRERYVREEVIDYRHQSEGQPPSGHPGTGRSTEGAL